MPAPPRIVDRCKMQVAATLTHAPACGSAQRQAAAPRRVPPAYGPIARSPAAPRPPALHATPVSNTPSLWVACRPSALRSASVATFQVHQVRASLGKCRRTAPCAQQRRERRRRPLTRIPPCPLQAPRRAAATCTRAVRVEAQAAATSKDVKEEYIEVGERQSGRQCSSLARLNIPPARPAAATRHLAAPAAAAHAAAHACPNPAPPALHAGLPGQAHRREICARQRRRCLRARKVRASQPSLARSPARTLAARSGLHRMPVARPAPPPGPPTTTRGPPPQRHQDWQHGRAHRGGRQGGHGVRLLWQRHLGGHQLWPGAPQRAGPTPAQPERAG